MTKKLFTYGLFVIAFLFLADARTNAQILLARGTLTSSRAGYYKDLSGLNYKLENGAPANLLGGFGSGMTYVSGNTFLAVPDRGPNAVSFNSLIDDTVSYINRFQTIEMELIPNHGSGLPFALNPQLVNTTLLHALLPLYYGDGKQYNIGSGVPALNNFLFHFFTGRSDNVDPNRSSQFQFDARLDPESIRVSNDGLSVFISDEYGPYIYQFSRFTGERLRTFELPAELFVANPADHNQHRVSRQHLRTHSEQGHGRAGDYARRPDAGWHHAGGAYSGRGGEAGEEVAAHLYR